MNDLCIGGAGIDGIIFVGALEYLHSNCLLDLKRFYGCSIGALIGILYITGISPKKILSMLMEIDTKELIQYDFSNIKTNNSILNNTLLNTLTSYIENHDTITIGEFVEKYNVDINIYSANLTTYGYTNFNKKDYPEIKLKDAVIASMSVPFIFPPTKIGENYYIDGCVKNILGAPPRDILIMGYSIILKNNYSNTYVGKVMNTMRDDWLPNSLYTIECQGKLEFRDILNLDNILSSTIIFEMYKDGINTSRNQLGHNNFTTWE